MATATDRAARVREAALRRLEQAHVAGRNTRHNRVANLEAIQSIVDGDVHYTWGIRGVQKFTFEEILDAISSITHCSKDPADTSGGGYISPASTLQGLEEAVRRIVPVARRGGTFALGTGHPGSLLLFYIELACVIRRLGGRVLEPERGARVPPNLNLDFVEGVAITTDRASLMHSHDYRAMEIMLASGPIDLVIADHGYAGAAINAGVPVIAVMDTNDPALAVAKRMGADLTIIPMDDNRPLSDYRAVIRVVEDLVSLVEDEEPEAARRSAPDLSERMRRNEELVSEWTGPTEALDDMMMSLLDGHHDQFWQMVVEHGDNDERVDDPLVTLAIYKQLHDALMRATLKKLARSGCELSSDEIIDYLRQPPRDLSDSGAPKRSA